LKSFRKFDYQKRGYLPYEDFDEALSQIMPSISRTEKKLRYRHAEKDAPQDCVPLERLAHIAMYMLMYTAFSNRWNSGILISKEFLETYFKDGFKDDEENADSSDSEAESEEEEDDEEKKQKPTKRHDSFYAAATDDEIQQEEEKLLSALEPVTE
jgi:hypothetical protein